MAKLFDQPIKDAHIIIESADDGNVDVRVSYPFAKLEAPLTALLLKATAKVPFLNKYVPGATAFLFAKAGVKSQAPPVVVAETPAPSVAAHEAAPVEAAPQA